MIDDFDDLGDGDGENHVAADFGMIVMTAQMNELEQEERRRAEERERAQELARQQNPNAMSLMRIAGLRTQKELDKALAESLDKEDLKSATADTKRKVEEDARLVSKFPPPTITVK